MPRNRSRAFGLLEIVVTLGFLALVAPPLIGTLALGMLYARKASEKHTGAALCDAIRSRLADPAWPGDQARNWERQVRFDLAGKMLGDSSEEVAWYEATLTAHPAPGYDSARLEAVRLEIAVKDTGRIIADTVVQRRRAP